MFPTEGGGHITLLDILDNISMAIIGTPGKGQICRTFAIGRREVFESFSDPARIGKKWFLRNKTYLFPPNYGIAGTMETLGPAALPGHYFALDFMVHRSFDQSANAPTAMVGYIHPTARSSNRYDIDQFNLTEYTANLATSNALPQDTPIALSTARIHTNHGNIPVLVLRCRGEDAATQRAQLGAQPQGSIQLARSAAQPGAQTPNLGFSGGYKLALTHATAYAAAPTSKGPPPLPQCEERRREDQWRRQSIFIARKRTNGHGPLSRGAIAQALINGAAITLPAEIINFTVGSSSQYATFSVPSVAIAIAVITALGQPGQMSFFGN
jgi:hypothetical protein